MENSFSNSFQCRVEAERNVIQKIIFTFRRKKNVQNKRQQKQSHFFYTNFHATLTDLNR